MTPPRSRDTSVIAFTQRIGELPENNIRSISSNSSLSNFPNQRFAVGHDPPGVFGIRLETGDECQEQCDELLKARAC